MSSDTWKGGAGAWAVAANWTAGIPTSTSSVIVNAGDPQITSAISIASLNNSALVDFLGAASSAISGAVVNSGFFNFDAVSGAGGSNVTIGGAFTNSGVMQLGASDNSLSANAVVKVASIINAIGAINIDGGANAGKSMRLDVTSGAAGFGVAGSVTGDVTLSGHATLEFATGQLSAIASGATLTLNGPNAFVADALILTRNSALDGLRLVAGVLHLADGANVSTTGALNNTNNVTLTTASGAPASSLTIGGAYSNNDETDVDSSGPGGSSLVVKGVLTNEGYLYIGSAALAKSTTVTATALVNDYDIYMSAGRPTAALTLLAVASAAGFGQAGVLSGLVSLSGNSEIRFASGEITQIASQSELDLSGPTAHIADASNANSNSALTGLTDIAGTFSLQSGALVATTGGLTLESFATVKIDTQYQLNGTGGSSLTVGGALINNGYFTLGDDFLTANTNAVVNSIVNTGNLYVYGSFSAPERSLLNVKSAAGFGVAGHLQGSVTLQGDASIQFVAGQISTIDSGGSLTMWGAQATVAVASSPMTNSALNGLSSVIGQLQIDGGTTIVTSGALNNSGYVRIDTGSQSGGSRLSIAGTLTNSSQLQIGSDGLTANSQVTATGVANTGTITLNGGASSTEMALLTVSGAAGLGTAGVVTGYVSLDGHSRIQFASGSFTSISATGGVELWGPSAFVANAASPNSNSALLGLSNVMGSLWVNDGASVTTTGALANSGYIDLDTSFAPKVTGGSKLTIGGVLTNSGTLSVGASGNTAGDVVIAKGIVNTGSVSLDGDTSASAALLSVTAGIAGFGAAGVLNGDVSLSGFAAIRFVAGQISRILSGAKLVMQGAHAFIADGASNANTALSGLSDIGGTVQISGGVTITTTASLSVEGALDLDSNGGGFSSGGGGGGSQIAVGGEIINSGGLAIGNSSMTLSDVVTATAITNNSGYGVDLYVDGGASAAASAILNVGSAAGFGTAGAVTGSVEISGYGSIRFTSGQITTIQANNSLSLNGAHAFVQDGAVNSNNALSGLSTVAGQLSLANGASVTTTGPLSVSGQLAVDGNYNNIGGSKLVVGGVLTDAAYTFAIGNASLTKAVEVDATGLICSVNLDLTGGSAAAAQALLKISGAAGFGVSGVVSGYVNLTGSAAIEFATGKITDIQNFASLFLDGPLAFIEDGVSNSNSALSGLATVEGTLQLKDGAAVTTTGALTSSGTLYVDYSGSGGSKLNVGGLLTNNGAITIGDSTMNSAASLSAATLLNGSSDTVNLNGDHGVNAQLTVAGAITNDGAFNIAGDSETLAGAVTGAAGSFNLSSRSTLQFNSSVDNSQTINFSGVDYLKLGDATAFAAAIAGFGAGDTLDLTTFGVGTTLQSFSGGVLTVKDGANTAHLAFSGSYTLADFGLTSTAAGSVISFV